MFLTQHTESTIIGQMLSNVIEYSLHIIINISRICNLHLLSHLPYDLTYIIRVIEDEYY